MWRPKFLSICLELLEIVHTRLLRHSTTLGTSKEHRSLAIVWKMVTKLFKHLAAFVKSLEIVEGFGSAEQSLFCRVWAEVGETSIGRSSVKLLGFEEGE